MGGLEFLLLVAGSAGGTAIAFVAQDLLSRSMGRFHDRGELARDGLVDLMSLMTAAEQLLRGLATVTPPKCSEDLVGKPSGVNIGAPAIPLDRYLTLGDERLHRLFFLIFDRHAVIGSRSAETTAAFAWLLEHDDDKDWASPLGREHFENLVGGREWLLEDVRELLLHASSACVALAELSERTPSLFRKGSIETFLRDAYKLSLDQCRERAAYYRPRNVLAPWAPGGWTLAKFKAEEDGFVSLRCASGYRLVAELGEEVAWPAEDPIVSMEHLGLHGARRPIVNIPRPGPARILDEAYSLELGPERTKWEPPPHER